MSILCIPGNNYKTWQYFNLISSTLCRIWIGHRFITTGRAIVTGLGREWMTDWLIPRLLTRTFNYSFIRGTNSRWSPRKGFWPAVKLRFHVTIGFAKHNLNYSALRSCIHLMFPIYGPLEFTCGRWDEEEWHAKEGSYHLLDCRRDDYVVDFNELDNVNGDHSHGTIKCMRSCSRNQLVYCLFRTRTDKGSSPVVLVIPLQEIWWLLMPVIIVYWLVRSIGDLMGDGQPL